MLGSRAFSQFPNMYTELERFEAFVYLMQEDNGQGMKESFCCRLFMTKLRFELACFRFYLKALEYCLFITIHARNAVKVAFYFSASSVDCKVSMTDIKISIITRFGRDTRQHKPVWWRMQVLKIIYLDVMHQLMKPIEI